MLTWVRCVSGSTPPLAAPSPRFERAGVDAVSKLSGTVVVLAGVAVAAYTLTSRSHTGAQITAPQSAVGATAVPNTSDPQKGLAELTAAAQPTSPPTPWQATAAPLAAPPVTTAEPRRSPAAKVIPPQAVRIAEAPPRVPVDQHKSIDAPALDSVGLTREIQRQLKRIGCYHGPISGVWSPAVRQAMKNFTDRVNATLPIERPDHILLAMVQSHQQAACSASCPAGQALAADRRCLPSALVARAGKQPPPPRPAPAKAPDDGPTPPTAPAAVAAAPMVPANRPDGRMSLTGPSAYGPAQHKAPTARRKRTTQHAKSARPPSYSYARARERRRDGPTFSGSASGFPWWAIRAFTQ